jgi:hypothetical protein
MKSLHRPSLPAQSPLSCYLVSRSNPKLKIAIPTIRPKRLRKNSSGGLLAVAGYWPGIQGSPIFISEIHYTWNLLLGGSFFHCKEAKVYAKGINKPIFSASLQRIRG